jgi:hypothetical protein
LVCSRSYCDIVYQIRDASSMATIGAYILQLQRKQPHLGGNRKRGMKESTCPVGFLSSSSSNRFFPTSAYYSSARFFPISGGFCSSPRHAHLCPYAATTSEPRWRRCRGKALAATSGVEEGHELDAGSRRRAWRRPAVANRRGGVPYRLPYVSLLGDADIFS